MRLLILLCGLLLSVGPLLCQNSFGIDPDLVIGDTAQLHVVVTKQGDRLVGRVAGIEGTNVVFQIFSTTERVTFSFSELRSVYVEKNSRRPGIMGVSDPPAEELFYTATGIPLSGRGSYRNNSILLSQVDFQVTNFLDLGIGAFIPAFISARIRFTIPITEQLHIGLCANGARPFDPILASSVAHVYVPITIGTKEQYFNMAAGWAASVGAARVFTLQFGGATQLSDRWRLVGEFMVATGRNTGLFIPGLLVSRMWPRHRLDLGVAPIFDLFVTIPMPLLGYRYYW